MRIVIIVALLFLAPVTGLFAGVYLMALERFDVESLKVIEVRKCESANYPCAYILGPDGYVHKISVGDSIGRNRGKVTKIDSCGLWFQEVRENDKGDWGAIDRVMFLDDMLLKCGKNLPENTDIVKEGKADVLSQKQIEGKAFKVFFNLHGFSLSNLQSGTSFSIPLISGVHSFPMDDKWIVTIWDAVSNKKKVKIFVMIFSKSGDLIKYSTNGPEPES